jgi:hypothetical protein
MKSKFVWFLYFIYVFSIICLFSKGYFSSPQVSNAIDAFLVGTLVAATLYYAIEVSQQNEVIQRESKKGFYYDLIWRILDPWTSQPKRNHELLQKLDLDFVDTGKKI